MCPPIDARFPIEQPDQPPERPATEVDETDLEMPQAPQESPDEKVSNGAAAIDDMTKEAPAAKLASARVSPPHLGRVGTARQVAPPEHVPQEKLQPQLADAARESDEPAEEPVTPEASESSPAETPQENAPEPDASAGSGGSKPPELPPKPSDAPDNDPNFQRRPEEPPGQAESELAKASERPRAPATSEYNKGHFVVDLQILGEQGGKQAIADIFNEVRNVEIPTEREKTPKELALINSVNMTIYEVGREAGVDLSERLPDDKFYRFYPDIQAMVDATGERIPEDKASHRPDGIHMIPTGNVAADAQTLADHTLQEASIKILSVEDENDYGDEQDPADTFDPNDYPDRQELEPLDLEIQPPEHPEDRLPGKLDIGFFNGYDSEHGIEAGINDLLARQTTERLGIDCVPREPELSVMVVGAINQAARSIGVPPRDVYHALVRDKFYGTSEGMDLLEAGLSFDAYDALSWVEDASGALDVAYKLDDGGITSRLIRQIEGGSTVAPLQMPWD